MDPPPFDRLFAVHQVQDACPGCSEPAAEAALEDHGWDLDAAVAAILGLEEQPMPAPAPPPPPPPPPLTTAAASALSSTAGTLSKRPSAMFQASLRSA